MNDSSDPALAGIARYVRTHLFLLLALSTLTLPALQAQSVTPLPPEARITVRVTPGAVGKQAAIECPTQLILGQGLTFQGQIDYTATDPVPLAAELRVNSLFLTTAATASQGTATVVASGANYAFGSVSGTGSVTYTATLSAVEVGTAVVTSTTFVNGATSQVESCEIEIIRQTDLQVAAAGPPSVRLGDTFTYALAAFNGGPNAAEEATLTVALPAAVAFVSATLSACTVDLQGQVTCPLGALAVGQQVDLGLAVTARTVGAAVMTATVSGPAEDPNTENNTTEVSTTIQPTDRTYDEVQELVVDLVPEVCPVPDQAMAYLRTDLLQPGDVVKPAFDSDLQFEVQSTQYFGWVDCDPLAGYGHLNGYVFVDLDVDGETTVVVDEQAWPEINGVPFPTGLSEDLTSEELIFGEAQTAVPVEPEPTVTVPDPTPPASKACAILVTGNWNTEKSWEEAAFDRDVADARANFISEQFGPRLAADRVFTLKNPTPDSLETFIRNGLPTDCDQIYFYYSGHGGAETGSLWLNESSMGLFTLVSALLSQDAEIFIYHGGCYSGNVVDALSESSLLYQRRVTVVTAASDSVPTYFERVALPDGSTGYRLGFSYHFLQCFGDPRADTDDDGLTSFEEAYTWVRTQDPAFTFGDNIFSTTAPQFFSHRPLEVQKVVAESFVEAGDTFTYVITLTNPNPATTARSITLFDVLPFRTRYRNVTTSQGQCRVSGDSISTVDCEVGDIAPGATVEIRIEADAAQPGDATNTVRVGDLSGIAELVIAEPPVFELCGQKFIDTNGNGLRDPGEPGGDGFVIELVSEDGVVNATTTTAAEDTNDDGVIDETEERGRFCFTGLERGRYIVREAPRPGWRQTTPTDPGTYTVDLATGTQPRILFGNTPDSTTAQDLSGRKFWDLNGNGVQDPHEPGADGFDFELLDADGQVVATATSTRADRNDDGQIDLLTEAGHFQFSNVPDGTYTLREVARAGWMQTAPAAGTYTVMLPAEELPELLFGNKGDPTTSTTVCGFKFFDANQNGVRDATEVGLDGFTIELLDASGAVVAQAVTSSQDLNGDGVIDPLTEQGRYCFPDLPPGTYTLREVVPAGWTQTAPVGGTYTFTVPSLELPDFDFGNYTERERDYGDLPDPCPIAPGPGYPTLRASGGASHVLGAGPFFGVTVDAEADGQPTFFANGDDLVGQADEDGLVDVRATIGGNGALDLSVLVTVPPPFFGAFVSGWIDLDDDCQFNNLPFPAGERILNAAPALMGVNVLTTPPGVAQPLGAGPKALRLRISAFGGLPPTGLARDGEVEDYYLDIDGQDYGDAPGAVDPTRPAFPGGYPTTLAQNGARHTIDEGFRLGQYLDADANVEGQYDALEDDLNQQQDDEDGIRLLEGFGTDTHVDAGIHATVQPGTVARLLPLPSTDGRLDAWIDWNRDGDWDDAGEQVFASVDIGPEMDEDDALEVAVPADADLGFTYARFRLSKQGGLAPTGLVFGGEVEDLLLQVVSATNVANEEVDGLPDTVTLHGNYPNPFNPDTQIRYDVARAAHVQLAVFNTLGQVVQVLVDEEQAPGTHQATWNGRSEDGAEMASGVYLARLVVIDAQGLRHVQTHALVLLR